MEFLAEIADVSLRVLHVVAGANERRLYSQATYYLLRVQLNLIKALGNSYCLNFLNSIMNTVLSWQCDFSGCTETLGVQSKAIPDSAMTASSSLASNSQPKVARLYAPQASGLQGVVDSRGGWSPQTSDQQQYLQVWQSIALVKYFGHLYVDWKKRSAWQKILFLRNRFSCETYWTKTDRNFALLRFY